MVIESSHFDTDCVADVSSAANVLVRMKRKERKKERDSVWNYAKSLSFFAGWKLDFDLSSSLTALTILVPRK